MRVLVTGGAGFIGSTLCERLVTQGDHVICLDNFHTGRRANIEQLTSQPNFQVVEHDIVDPLDIAVDRIFNLACPASPIKYQSDPVRTLKTSIVGTLNLLELAQRTGARILQASTSEIMVIPLFIRRKSPTEM